MLIYADMLKIDVEVVDVGPTTQYGTAPTLLPDTRVEVSRLAPAWDGTV